MESLSRPKDEVIKGLRQQIARLEHSYAAPQTAAFSFHIPEIDAALPDEALQSCCLHEVGSGDPRGAGATTGFVSALTYGLAGQAPVAWISREAAVYMPGLLTYGLTPQQMIFVQTRNERQTLWAMEEALRSRAFSVVIGEVDKADLTATRRLQLAAEAGAGTCLLVRLATNYPTTSSVTRWIVYPAASVCEPGIPGVGDPCWRLVLDKAKGGRPGEWLVMWKDEQFALAPTPEVQIKTFKRARQ